MSTATASTVPNLTHLPHNPHTSHTAHPLPLREQAFTLHCQGLRSPAIAQELGVPERTIRAWIASALDALKDDLQLNRRQQLLLAVERQHQLTAAAWQQFEREAAARDALLDAALAAIHAAAHTTAAATDSATRPISVHLPASSLAPRYLSLILQANKEANRLLGLHTHTLLQLLSSEPDPTDSEIPAESATAPLPTSSPVSSVSSVSSTVHSPLSAESATALPAQTATIFESAQADFAAAGHPGAVSTAGSPPPAESATAINTTPCASVSSVLNPHSPAKTATGAAGGLAAGIQPARSDLTTSPAIATTNPALPAESATASPASSAFPAKTATDPTGAPVIPAESATHAMDLAADFGIPRRRIPLCSANDMSY